MAVIVCSFPDCKHRTDLQAAHRCQVCTRYRCEGCGRCSHERSTVGTPAIQRSPLVAPPQPPGYGNPVPSRRTPNTAERNPPTPPIDRTQPSAKLRRRTKPNRAPGRDLLTPAEVAFFKRIGNATPKVGTSPGIEQVAAARAKTQQARKDAAAQAQRSRDAVASEAAHQAELAKLGVLAPSLRIAPAVRPAPIKHTGGHRCVHGMEAMNCASCDPRRYPPSIRLRR